MSSPRKKKGSTERLDAFDDDKSPKKVANAYPTSSFSHDFDLLDMIKSLSTILLVILYAEYIGIRQIIQTSIKENEDFRIKFNQNHIFPEEEIAALTWTSNGKFDHNLFLKEYKCNDSHPYIMEVVRQDPVVLKFKNFLAPGEAEHLVEIGRPLMEKSRVVGQEEYYHPGRTSSNAFLNKAHDKVVQCIERRASQITDKPVPNIENLQYFGRGTPGSEREVARGGQRIITIFVYLNTVNPENGGHTDFPNLNLKVPATKNTAILWYDTTADLEEDPRTFHGGAKVIGDAEKFGLNIWIRPNEFV